VVRLSVSPGELEDREVSVGDGGKTDLLEESMSLPMGKFSLKDSAIVSKEERIGWRVLGLRTSFRVGDGRFGSMVCANEKRGV